MRNRLVRSFVALTTFCLALAMASPSLAQWRDRDPGRYGRDPGRYGMVNVDQLIRQAENRSDQFVAALEQRNNRGFLERILGDNERLGGLRARAHDLESQLNILREESYRRGNDEESYRRGNDYGLRSSVASVMSIAEDINRAMYYRQLNPVVERQWSILKSDLNRLARAYNLRQLG
jgi:hypothetical protein